MATLAAEEDISQKNRIEPDLLTLRNEMMNLLATRGKTAAAGRATWRQPADMKANELNVGHTSVGADGQSQWVVVCSPATGRNRWSRTFPKPGTRAKKPSADQKTSVIASTTNQKGPAAEAFQSSWPAAEGFCSSWPAAEGSWPTAMDSKIAARPIAPNGPGRGRGRGRGAARGRGRGESAGSSASMELDTSAPPQPTVNTSFQWESYADQSNIFGSTMMTD